jgi:hypothetical protein
MQTLDAILYSISCLSLAAVAYWGMELLSYVIAWRIRRK